MEKRKKSSFSIGAVSLIALILCGILFKRLLGFKVFILTMTAITVLLMILAVWGFVSSRKKSNEYNRGNEKGWAEKHLGLFGGIVISSILLPFYVAFEGIISFSYTQFIPFIVIPLIVGILAAIPMIMLTKGTAKMFVRIIVGILIGFMAAFVCCGHIMNLNYAFDTSEPEVCTAEITDKDRSSNGIKLPTSYDFDIAFDGVELNLKVSSSEYDFYDVGDTVRFYKYKGAFGKPFYISESKR